MRRPVILAALALTLAALFAACSQPPTGPSMTAQEAGDEVGSLSIRFGEVLSDPAVSGFAEVLAGLTPSGLPYEDGNELPRGAYEFDEVSETWVEVGDSDDLELNWTVEPGSLAARLLVDWDASTPTVTRTVPGGEEFELPTGANATLTVGGEVKADIDQTATWPVNQCGTLTEPGDLFFDGVVTHGAASLTIDGVGLSVDAGETTASAGTSGRLELAVPAGEAWVDWDVNLDLAIARDEATCIVADGDVTSGRVQLGAGVETSDGSASAGVATDFAPVFDTVTSALTGVELTNGRLTLDGVLAVTWEGVLDDADGDGVPGENLDLTFADGTTTLEDFIREHFGLVVLGSRVLSAVR